MINGDVDGKTVVLVNNTGPSADVFNDDGIPVVDVNGATGPQDFHLKKPIDTGFFTWDLFFEPAQPTCSSCEARQATMPSFCRS